MSPQFRHTETLEGETPPETFVTSQAELCTPTSHSPRMAEQQESKRAEHGRAHEQNTHSPAMPHPARTSRSPANRLIPPHGLCPAAPLAAIRRAYSTPGVSPPIVCRHLLSTDTCTHAAAGSQCERAASGLGLSRSWPLELDACQALRVSSCSSSSWHKAHDETSAFGKPLNPQITSKA